MNKRIIELITIIHMLLAIENTQLQQGVPPRQTKTKG